MNLLLRLEFDGERRTTSRLTELLLPATYKNRQRKLVWEVKENSGVPQTVFFQLAGKSNVHSKSFILQAVSGMSGVKRVAFAKNVQAALSKVGSQASGQGGRSRAQAQADTAKTLSRSAATPEDEDEDDFGDCMHCHGRFYGAAFMDHESTCTANPHPARSRKRPAPAPEARESVSTTATAALESLRQAQMALTSADNSLGLAEQAEEASGAGTPSARSVPAAQGRPRPRDHAATRDQPKRGGEAGGAREQRRAADEANPHPTWTVQAFVDHIGKKLWNVEGEGNCFFLAVLLALDLISRELAMKPDAETNNNVQEMRKRAVEHIKQHFLDATNPLAGVYGKLIATCLASNATRLQGDGPTDPKRLEALKKQVEYDVRLLERNNEWQPEQGYVFEFMIWAVACLVQKPILCFEPKSSLDDKLYPYFKVYGDSWEKGTMMDACAPFAKLHKLPALRDYDLSDGAGECANKDAILLNTRQYIMLYFGFAAIQAVVDQMMLSEGPYINRVMFDLHKKECLEEIERILTSLPVASTNMRYYTEIEMKALKERGLLTIIGAHITSIVKNKVRRPGASSYYPNHPYNRARMRAASSFICAYAHSRSHTGPSAVQVTPHMECWMGSGQAHRAHRERGSAGRHAVYVGSGRNHEDRSDA